MGAMGSGRYRTRNVGALGAVPRLDIRLLRRGRLLSPGFVTKCTLCWSRRGVNVAQAAVKIDLTDGDAGSLTVAVTLNGLAWRQDVGICSRPMPYGGRRFYFQCPKTGKACDVVALVDGQFASRRAQRLAYWSQSEDEFGRASRRVERLRARLWPEGRGRPRGRNRARLGEAWIEATAELDGHIERVFARLAAVEADPA
jgi:hypothetical protein